MGKNCYTQQGGGEDLITLRGLFNKVELPLQPIVDNYNKNRIVQSVTVMESIELSRWLQGGELILVSGKTLISAVEKQPDLMRILLDYHCAGLIVKEGVAKGLLFLEKFVQQAESNRFPLFMLPENTTYLEIMTPINEQLFIKKQAAFFAVSSAKYLMQTPHPDLEILHLQGLPISKHSKCFVLYYLLEESVLSLDDESVKSYRKLTLEVSESLEVAKYQGIIEDFIVLDETTVLSALIVLGEKIEDPDRLFKMIVPKRNNSKALSKFGVSTITTITNAAIAAKQAQFASLMSRFSRSTRNYITYQEIEFYSLVNDVAVKSQSDDFFGFTEELEKSNQLLETLVAYFENNEQLKMTSESLFIHINTLRYRLDKIAEKTGLDYTKTADKLKLFLGVIFVKNKRK